MGLEGAIHDFCAEHSPSGWRHEHGSAGYGQRQFVHTCIEARLNVLRMMAGTWNMCENLKWMVCAARGKLPGQAGSPGVMTFAVAPKSRPPQQHKWHHGVLGGYEPNDVYDAGRDPHSCVCARAKSPSWHLKQTLKVDTCVHSCIVGSYLGLVTPSLSDNATADLAHTKLPLARCARRRTSSYFAAQLTCILDLLMFSALASEGSFIRTDMFVRCQGSVRCKSKAIVKPCCTYDSEQPRACIHRAASDFAALAPQRYCAIISRGCQESLKHGLYSYITDIVFALQTKAGLQYRKKAGLKVQVAW
eukprot:6206259-Pleurochrysis_carterae.AAC.2